MRPTLSRTLARLAAAALLTGTALAAGGVPASAQPQSTLSQPALAQSAVAVSTEYSVKSRADDAIAWFAARNGSTAYQGYCEKAVENAYGRTGVYASAKANWNDAVRRGVAHRGDLNPPKGALVFWDIGAPYGHVGLAKGDGTFWATSVNGRIGHARLPYYSKYLGWAWPNF